MLGLDAKRMIRRAEFNGKTMNGIGSQPTKGKRGRDVTVWTYDGHSGEHASVKEIKKNARENDGLSVKYVRGLRVYIKDNEITKFVGRERASARASAPKR